MHARGVQRASDVGPCGHTQSRALMWRHECEGRALSLYSSMAACSARLGLSSSRARGTRVRGQVWCCLTHTSITTRSKEWPAGVETCRVQAAKQCNLSGTTKACEAAFGHK
jgi:hypothetical protein